MAGRPSLVSVCLRVTDNFCVAFPFFVAFAIPPGALSRKEGLVGCSVCDLVPPRQHLVL